jgi:hypothetical protein
MAVYLLLNDISGPRLRDNGNEGALPSLAYAAQKLAEAQLF